METIAKYEILGKIGSGGMGEVYKGFDTLLDRNVAIKLMHSSLMKNKEHLERLMVEARAAAKLIHPNVVTIYDIGESEQGRYIVMEYVDGSPLTELIYDQGFLNIELSRKIITQLLSALSLAHKNGIYHRDVKPENILISKKNEVKVLDFGIARIGDKSGATSAGEVLGTLEYMAPEQMLGQDIDQRCDLYSVGVLLYQMLTQKLPFTGNNSVDILFKKLNEDPIAPSYFNANVPKAMDKAVLKAIHHDKEERWESAEELIDALHTKFNAKAVASNDFWSAQSTDQQESKTLNQKDILAPNDGFHQVFIGRDQEFKNLHQAFKKTINNLGNTIILSGEAGIGKSTLASQFRNFLEHQDTWVLQGTCLYQEGMDAYLPYIDAIRGFLSHENNKVSKKQRNELKKMMKQNVPVLSKFTERLKTTFITQFNGEPSTQQQNINLFEEFYNLLSMLSELRPTVLIIDDLQWADEASLKLFHYLARKIEKKQILLFGIMRSDHYDLKENGKPKLIVDILARMRREYLFDEIKVQQFHRKDSDLLVDKLLPNSAFSEEFYENLYRETKGNPFFLIETLKALKNNGQIFINGDIWVDKKIDFNLEVPNRVEDIFIRRLSALNSEEREILQIASVLGYKFDPYLLAKLLDTKKIFILQKLQKMETEHQVITSAEDSYQFEHPMLGDLLYSEIPAGLVKEYHSMIAEILEEIHAPHYGAMIGDVARHFYKAGIYKKAVPLLFAAGERSFELSAYREAVLYFEDIINTVGGDYHKLPQTLPVVTLYFKLGICYEEIGELENSLKIYDLYSRVSMEHENQTKHIDGIMRMGRVQDKLGEFKKSLDLYEQCLALTKKHNIKNVLSRVYNKIGVHFFHKGNYDEALKYFSLTIKSIDSDYGEYDKAHAYTNLGIIANIIRGDYGIALENFKKALKIYQARNDTQGQATVYHNIGMFYSEQGQWLESVKALEKCLQLADETEAKHLRALTHLNMGKAFVRQHKTAKSKRLTGKALKMFRRMSDVISIGEAYHVFGIIYSKEGDFIKAEEFLQDAIRIFRNKNYLEGLAETQLTYGEILSDKGEVKRAKAYLDEALEIFKSIKISSRIKEVQQKLQVLNTGTTQHKVNNRKK
ncbi:MAG: tetratricopeptide repeat protein, partial [Caldithrix sp.]|nr:tetratricopeptide repeat protein [Caldithrix sp.]